MANEGETHRAEAKPLMARKLALLQEVFALTQQELLLVDLEGLTPLQARKDAAIAEMEQLDRALERAAVPDDPAHVQEWQQELAQLLEAILENGKALEARIAREHAQLKIEARELQRETRLRQYLESARAKGAHVNLKK